MYFIDTQKADEAFWKQKKTCCAPSKKKQLFFGINSAPSKEVDDAQNRVSLSNAIYTGKFLSEALIFASTNPQYDDRLFIVHENCQLRIPAEHVVFTNCCFCFDIQNNFGTQHVLQMLRASEKDLPVWVFDSRILLTGSKNQLRSYVS